MKHTIHTLHAALVHDLTLCHTAHEKIMVKAIGGKEIRELAEKTAQARPLTQAETRTAMQYGYKS